MVVTLGLLLTGARIENVLAKRTNAYDKRTMLESITQSGWTRRSSMTIMVLTRDTLIGTGQGRHQVIDTIEF